jgi:hypothetical protein
MSFATLSAITPARIPFRMSRSLPSIYATIVHEGKTESQSISTSGRLQTLVFGNLQRFGMGRVSKTESLQEIIREMKEDGTKPPKPITQSALSKSLSCSSHWDARK